MKTRLFSIVSFVAVAPGDSVSLPHGINVSNGTSIVPDEIKRRTDGDFEVTADTTDVTVTNTGAEASDIDVLCERWHTIERQLGLDGGNDEALSIRPWESFGSNDVLSQATVFQWSPEAPADKLLEGRIFDDFKECLAAAQAAVARGFTKVEMWFDKSYSTTLGSFGNPVTEIPSSLVNGYLSPTLGFKVWDFEGIVIGGGYSIPTQPFGGPAAGVDITFAPGAFIQPKNGDITIAPSFGYITNEAGAVDSPLVAAPGWGVVADLEGSVYFESRAGAAPLIKPDPTAGFIYYALSGNGVGGIGAGSPAPAPVIDLGGVFNIILSEGTGASMEDNTLIDSVGGAGYQLIGPWRIGRGNNAANEQPALGEATNVFLTQEQGFNLKMPVSNGNFDLFGNAPIAGSGTVLQPGLNFVDSTAGDVTVKAPSNASPLAGQVFSVKNVGSANKVIVEPFAAANVRNAGGVSDVVAQPNVLPGNTAEFVANGGMDGTNVGGWDRLSNAAADSAAYTPTNVTPDRAFDADTVTVAELADIVGTMIADLQAAGRLS